MRDIKDLSLYDLTMYMKENNMSAFRATQIFEWIYKDADSFDKMGNIPKDIREHMSQHFFIGRVNILKKQVSQIDSTAKYLLSFSDNNTAECVLMEYKHGNTICVSTQVGCRMGCNFCASTLGGRIRDLTVGEMIEEVMAVERDSQKKISNIVLMGSGEPFDNYDNVIKFLHIINHHKAFNIGARHITISTCGIVPKIEAFANEDFQVSLAISLHATTDEKRNEIMPINKKYPIDELIKMCKYYIKKTNRRLTFEYALIEGQNDSILDARDLARLLSGMLCHVNLIPVNDITERTQKKPSREKVYAFAAALKNAGIEATVRRELGSDIDAACGQLRNNMGV